MQFFGDMRSATAYQAAIRAWLNWALKSSNSISALL